MELCAWFLPHQFGALGEEGTTQSGEGHHAQELTIIELYFPKTAQEVPGITG